MTGSGSIKLGSSWHLKGPERSCKLLQTAESMDPPDCGVVVLEGTRLGLMWVSSLFIELAK